MTGQGDLEYALRIASRQTMDRVRVGPGATPLVIPCVGVNWVIDMHTGAYICFETGVLTRAWAVVASNTPTTLVLTAPLASAPTEGDEITILPKPPSMSVTMDMLRDLWKPVHTRQVVVGDVIEVELDTGEYGGQPNVLVGVTSSIATTFYVEASSDEATWWLLGTIILAVSGASTASFDNAFRYVRVRCTDMGDHTVEIAAAR